MSWLPREEQRGTWIHDLKPLTQYVVRARRASPDPAEYARYGTAVSDLSHHFALEEVIKRDVHVAALDERLAQWRQPVVVSTSIGDFKLERSMGNFSGVIEWCGEEVAVMFDIDEDSVGGAETCTVALARLEEYVADAVDVDSRWCAFAAAKLTELTNDWQAQADDGLLSARKVITTEYFAARIRLSELSVAADGAVTPYYNDDELLGACDPA